MLTTTKNDLTIMDPILSKLDRVEYMIDAGVELANIVTGDNSFDEGINYNADRRFAAAADLAREALEALELARPNLDDRHNYDCARAIFTELLATAEAK